MIDFCSETDYNYRKKDKEVFMKDYSKLLKIARKNNVIIMTKQFV